MPFKLSPAPPCAILCYMGIKNPSHKKRATAAADGSYTYTVENGKATMTGYTGPGGAVAVPATLGGCPVTTIGECALWECTSLANVHFAGNAPAPGLEMLSATPATVYYLPGTTGWGATYAGRPTAVWQQQAP